MKTEELLPPNNFLEVIQKRALQLQKIISLKKNSISKKKEGTLRVCKKHESFQYYFSTSQNKNGEYIPKKKIAIAKSLAQKEYDEKIIKTFEKELAVLEKLFPLVSVNQDAAIGNCIHKKKQNLITPVTLPNIQFTQQWNSIPSLQKKISDFPAPFYTENGEKLRSKSEVIIANALRRNQIPYKYEFPVKTKSGIFFPDFCCLNLQSRNEILWEHFGLMDDTDYATKAINKLHALQDAGYILGHNLIVTMETSSTPINLKQIEQLIQIFLR